MNNLSDYALLKELQRRLKRSDELSAELYHLKLEILELNQKLEQSEIFKSHFISNITNELVNPMTSLLAFSKILYNNGVEDKEKMEKFSKLIFREAFDLDFQLRNIFFAAKFESGQYTIEKSAVSLKELFQTVITDYEHLLKAKNIEVKIEIKKDKTNDVIVTDSEKLKVVISNLLNNSIRFSNKDDKIIIKANIVEESVLISVRDFGIGVSPDLTDKVFERFYRIDNSINSENKGSGLGLSVSKRIIEILNGSIKFEDHENGVEVIFNIEATVSPIQNDNLTSTGSEFFFDGDLEVF